MKSSNRRAPVRRPRHPEAPLGSNRIGASDPYYSTCVTSRQGVWRDNLADLLARTVHDERIHESLVDAHRRHLLANSLPSRREFHERAVLWNKARLEALRGLRRRLEQLLDQGGSVR
jgi:hypothetical protein